MSMGCVKWIISDLDGTLLAYDGERHSVRPEAFAAIKRAVAKGAEFSIATGRSHEDAIGVLRLDPEVEKLTKWIVACNGSVVYDCKRKEFARTSKVTDADGEYVVALAKKLCELGYYAVVGAYRPDGTITLDELGWEARFVEFCSHYHGGFSPTSFNRGQDIRTEKNAVKYVLYLPPWCKGGSKEGLAAAVAADTEKKGVISSDFAIEFNPKDISKGEALKWLAPRINQTLDAALTIGDSGNDMTMLRAAKYSVCPKSSAEAVKACAKTVIDAPASIIVQAAIDAHINLIRNE